jgi:ABC-type bacteriocin/lantibiotic exporter with double-glycine peptidase domain
MILNYLCPPALIYIVFFTINIVIDLSEQKYKNAFTQLIICSIFTCLLQIFCMADMSLLSWVLVFIPIILYTYMVLVIFLIFRLNKDDKQYIVKNN